MLLADYVRSYESLFGTAPLSSPMYRLSHSSLNVIYNVSNNLSWVRRIRPTNLNPLGANYTEQSNILLGELRPLVLGTIFPTPYPFTNIQNNPLTSKTPPQALLFNGFVQTSERITSATSCACTRRP